MNKSKNGFLFVVADINGHILNVPKYVMDKVDDLGSPEAVLYNQYRAKYPDFKIQVFESILLQGIGLITSKGIFEV